MAFLKDYGSGELFQRKRIGLFDSGLGGLSVLDRMAASFESDKVKEFIYVGDTARCPYGDRPAREISLFVEQIVSWLMRQNVDGIVMACNTSAAIALDTAKSVAKVPVYDLISPASAYVARTYRKVGVMATSSTIRSKAFSRGIHAINKDVKVIEMACPDLVPIIESGQVGSQKSALALTQYARKLLSEKVEAVVLGCTHFPFLKDQLVDLIGNEIAIIDPAEILVAHINGRNGKSANGGQPSNAYTASDRLIINTTGNPSKFRETAKICLGYALSTVNGITVDELTLTAPQPVVVDRKVSTNTVTPNMVPAT